jgi:leucyl-tRNA synthetase
MVLAPEHPLVDALVPTDWPGALIGDEWSEVPAAWKGIFGTDVGPPAAVRRYREFAAQKSELERQAEGKDKTGVFTGAYAINPVNDARIPIFVADYVLMGYGTGAIMAVPAHDQRDLEFAGEFDLSVEGVIQPPADWFAARGIDADAPAGEWPESFVGDGVAVNSANADVSLDGLGVDAAKAAITEWLVAQDVGEATVNYKLHDWLFSRQRYWGEPFPIVYDDLDLPVAVPESMLPVELPEIVDFEPEIVADDAASVPAPPLSRAEAWGTVELDLGDGPKRYRRELNTMPQWAGSCWYYLRYLDPTNEDAFVSVEAERYWMQPGPGGVKLYVGGVEHAVLHLLYARFWHKVLFDLGHVSTPEPFQRLVNQGYILAAAYADERGAYVDADRVEERDGQYFFEGKPVTREFGKMGKSLRNAVAPDDLYRDYGADTLRLYEMFMGPLDKERPWSTADIVGVHRFLQRLWRNFVDENTGASRVSDEPADEVTRRLLHRTIDAVHADKAALSFNTAIARLFELNNHLTTLVQGGGVLPREVAVPLTLMVAPLAPHVAEELWARLGHADTITYEKFPQPDARWLVEERVEVPVQINGKVRARVEIPVGADAAAHEAAARAEPRIAELLTGATVRQLRVVPGKIVNFVVA